MANLTDEQIAGYALAAGFPPQEIPKAVAIALAESNGRTDATNNNSNGTIDRGVWQINSIHSEATGDMFNPNDNARAAKMIYAAAGNKWTPWSTNNNGMFLPYMVRGNKAAGNPAGAGALPPSAGGPSGPSLPSLPSLSFSGMTDLFKKLTTAGFWVRIGAFFLGLFLLGMGILDIIGSNKTVQGVTKAAVKTGIKVAMA